jgi:DNA-directed RNA polymerase subunit RPC12/RpoP
MSGDADRYACDDCGTTFAASAATRTATMGGLDADAWQTLCCPNCGARVKTVFVGRP